MTIQAIQTRYAGCYFRSRLEARWAVFFDTLGIEWIYEPEGYVVGIPDDHFIVFGDEPEINQFPQRRYLPDFWLPRLRLWVEVKGQLTHDDFETICLASYSHEGWGLPSDPEGTPFNDDSRNCRRILILGSIPRIPTKQQRQPIHVQTRFHKGTITIDDVLWTDDGECERTGFSNDVHQDSPEWFGNYAEYGPHAAVCQFNDGFESFNESGTPRQVAKAYVAARSARFEHGQSG